MGNEVYANGREVSCKAGSGKTICAFPDVCFTPPENPATPPGVPIPYPNTGMDSDATSGSTTVQISGQEVMLKNKSYFQRSSGDEAGCAAKKGVLTSVNMGKVYFTSWSMDVKIEGENVVRHLDLTTHNHASVPGNTPPWPFMDAMAVAQDPCATEKANEESACKNPPPKSSTYKKPDGTTGVKLRCSPKCREAKACRLVAKENDKAQCCEPNNTGDHLIEVNCFTPKGGREKKQTFPEFAGYDHEKAPTACARNPGALKGMKNNHNAMQAWREEAKLECTMGQYRESRGPMKTGPNGEEFNWTYAEASAAGAASHHKVNPHCSDVCTKAQLDNYHQNDPNGPKCADSTPVRTEIRSWNDAQARGGRSYVGKSYPARG
jgi:hypothetical protein